jgi:hypothetical protein
VTSPDFLAETRYSLLRQKKIKFRSRLIEKSETKWNGVEYKRLPKNTTAAARMIARTSFAIVDLISFSRVACGRIF